MSNSNSIPKIIFKYSRIYDIVLHEVSFKKKFFRHREYFAERKIRTLEKLKTFKSKWKKYEKNILEDFEKFSDLKWIRKEIYVYPILPPVLDSSLSQPLTLVFSRKNFDTTMIIFTEEIAHVFEQDLISKLSKNQKEEFFEDFRKKYPKENPKEATHIRIFSFLRKVLKNNFSENQMKSYIQILQKYELYKNAWEKSKNYDFADHYKYKT